MSDLHPSGISVSLWHATVDVPAYPKLSRSGSCDVCVVGAGIAGLSVAYQLAREGMKVVVLDDGPIGGGETGRTTGHLADALDDRIHWLQSVHGDEGARLAVASHGAAINRIEQIIELEEIDCDFERLDGYLMPRDPSDTSEIEKEAAAAQRAGSTDVAVVDRAPIAGMNSGRSLRFPRQAQFHALKYIVGLARAIQKYDGAIHGDSHVEGIEGGDPCTVKVQGGAKLTAKAVVVCTNASISDYVQTHVKLESYRTYAIAAVVPRGVVEKALYWDTGDAYHYARIHRLDEPVPGALGDAQFDALIVGGEDHLVGRGSENADERYARLERWTRERWPETREVIYRWSGQILEPSDGVAYIGRNPDGAENVYMASGDSGHGLTHGTIAGILISDMIAGRDNPWEKLYDPKRVSLRVPSVKELAKHNIDVAVQYAKGWLSPDVASVDDIRPGEGRVIRRGAHKIAVYRDEQGEVIEKSAVCTHLKCIVEWNGAEKSWDCPCHGSRFAPTGEVLNGPAIMALEDVAPEQSRGGRKRSSKAKA